MEPTKLGIEALDRRRLREVERLALRDALHDVEQDDVAELLEADQMSERAADLACADQSNFVTRHDENSLHWSKARPQVLSPFA